MDPITAAIGLAVGATALFAWISKRQQGGKPPDPCGPAAAAAAAVGGISAAGAGAQQGAQAGPYGAAAGAGVGAALAATSAFTGPCGGAWSKQLKNDIANAAKDVCAQADAIYAQIRRAGGSIPGYNHLNCDQKLAAAIGMATNLGIALPAALAAGAVVGGAERTAKNLTDTTTKAGGGSVSVAGHKLW